MHIFSDLPRGARALLLMASIIILAEGAYLFYIQTNPPQVVSACMRSIAAWEKAEPQAAASQPTYQGAIASVRFEPSLFPQAKNHEAAIKRAMEGGANFAGHYVVAEWSCGERCQDHAVIDVITGTIVAYGIRSEVGVGFNRESSLIITNPLSKLPTFGELAQLPFEEQRFWYNTPREYYALSEGEGEVSVVRLCVENALGA